MYSPRSHKELLPHNSAHSKVVKRRIATLMPRVVPQKVPCTPDADELLRTN